MTTRPRQAAVRLLDDVLGRRITLSEATGRAAFGDMPAAERAEAQRLATATLRFLGRADALLAPRLRKPPPLRVQNLLRLGATEICAIGTPPHAVVSELVALAGADRRTRHLKGLVNAVLRRIAREGAAEWSALPPGRLPDWIRAPVVASWGAQVAAAIEAVHEMTPPVDLVPRDPADADALAADVGGEVLPTGSVRIRAPVRISGLPGYAEGRFWVQDAAAAIPARLTGAAPGRRVLDMCAAPGGKTLQLAAAGADVTALDISDSRLGRLEENLARTGLAARVLAGDALEHRGGPYDAILLDAPCSATGTIRRHPELPHIRDGSEVPRLVELQGRMLAHAATLLAPGGRLVYATCSLLPAEGEERIARLLEGDAPLAPAHAALSASWIAPEWRVPDLPALRLRPDFWADRGGMDGFFVAVLERT